MKFEIKNRWNSELIFSIEADNWKIAIELAIKSSADLCSADLRYVDLRSADLRYVDLRSADLRYADLRYADLSSADLRSADLSSADLSSADLRSADLRSADLRSADLRYVDLSSADLRSANLSSANLSSANLRSADLRYAKTDKRYLQIGCIGSRKDMFIYCFDDDIVWCGCWKGTLKEFEERVKRTHKDNKQFLKEYVGAIKYIRSLK